MEDRTKTKGQDEVPVEKKVYTTPTLTEYGNIAELTGGGSGNGNEPHNGSKPSPANKWP
jgi:hypothetical protein